METKSMLASYPLEKDQAAALICRSLGLDAPSISTEDYRGAKLYLIDKTFNPETDPCVCAIGAFDGVHTGHASLIERMCADAAKSACASVAVSFNPDPMQLIAPDRVGIRLLSVEDRVLQLARLGISALLVLPFTEELKNTNYKDFALKVLTSYLNYQSIHVGSDFRMGSGRGGNVQALQELGAAHGFSVYGEELLGDTKEIISATRIRNLLGEAKLKEAHELLGRCHFVRGRVSHGRGEGSGFGFPTANVEANLLDCIPAEAVYACYVHMDGKAWPAAVNVGAPPSFSVSKPAFLEAHLIGFNGDLYECTVEVVFLEHLRPSRKFKSFEQLQQTVFSNIEWTRENLGDGAVEVRP